MHNRWRLIPCSLVILLPLLCTCTISSDKELDPQKFRLPTGAALHPSGGWLFIVNSNLDQAHSGSTVMSVDLGALDDAFSDEPLPSSSETTEKNPCRWGSTKTEPEIAITECDERWFIDPTNTVEFPSGGSNIAVTFTSGEKGPVRLLLLSKIEAAITWVDTNLSTSDADGASLRVNCGQKPRRCSDEHVIDSLRQSDYAFDNDPSRLYIGRGSSGFGYVPHLLGSAITLVRLAGSGGPQLVDVSKEFYVENSAGFAGGFAVAERPCVADSAPSQTKGCTIPLLYTTHRFWRGIRTFTISPGTAQFNDDLRLYPPDNVGLRGLLPGEDETRPILADLKFADPSGDRLLVVQTSPPSLVIMDTSIDASTGGPVDTTLHVIPVCTNPNILEIFYSTTGQNLAFVSCFSEDRLAVVDLNDLNAVFIDVDDGPNELVVDYGREKLYVVHTLDDTIGAIELSRKSPDYLKFVYRIGLGPN